MHQSSEAVRWAVRGLLRAPGFVATAILTLAWGIGLAVAVFTVANALLLRPLAVHDQDRIAVFWGETRDGKFADYPLSVAGARDFALRTESRAHSAFVASFGALPVPVTDGDQVSRLRRALVSGEFFDVLGARPALGRALRTTDDLSGAAPVVVLSHSAWQQRFAGDPQVLGRQIRLYQNDRAYTIVGVMHQGLDYPRGTDFWAPLMTSFPSEQLPFLGVRLISRIRTGATLPLVRADLTAFFQRQQAAPWERELRGVGVTLPRLVLGDTRPAIVVFGIASALLLLIACCNVANLLLVRGLARQRELAVRAALGASRRQISTQLLIENSLLAITAGIVGIGVAIVCVQVFVRFAPTELPRLAEIHIHAAVLVAAIGITCVALLLFGLVPAFSATRVHLVAALRAGTRSSATRRARLIMEGLVCGQIAIAFVILSTGGLIAQTLLRLERAQLAFTPNNLLIAELALRSEHYADATSQVHLMERLLPKLKVLPEVSDASPVVATPFAGASGWDGRFASEGQTVEQALANPMLNMEVVAPGYFATLGITLLRGRGFSGSDREGAPAVVVISRAAAEYYWPGADPIGKHLRMGRELERSFTVVGVVPDTRYRDLRSARPSIYFPIRQSFFPFAPLALAIRTSGAPGDAVSAVRSVIAASEPGVALASAAPFESFLDRPLAQPRLNALLLAVFAIGAVALASLGLFSVLATMVRQRSLEFGVRTALGAQLADLQSLVVRHGLAIAVTGVLIGLPVAFLATRFLAALLYDINPLDAPTFVAATGFLIATAAFASLLPARAAARVQPLSALRS